MSTTQPLDVSYYVACLKLQGKDCLVVGGGPIALEKIEGLLVAGADVTVIALEAVPEVAALADSADIKFERRAFAEPDLVGRFLVVAATSDEALNRSVHAGAEARNQLVNVVDVPPLCNFILPAVTRIGPIAIAVSTSGASPALAKRMRDEIDALFGDEHARLAVLLNEVRDWARATLPTYADRKAFFESIVTGAPDPIELLRAGRDDDVRALIKARRAEATA